MSQRGSLREHASASALVAVGTVTLNLAMVLYHRQMSERLGTAYGDFSALNGLVNIAVVVAGGGSIWLTRLVAHDAALNGEGAALHHLRRLAPRLGLVAAGAALAMGLAALPIIAFLHLASWTTYALAATTVMAGLTLMTARSLLQGVQRFGSLAASYLLEAAGRAAIPALLAGLFGLAGCLAGTTVVALFAGAAVLPLLWHHRDAKSPAGASSAGGGLAQDTIAMALFSLLCFLDILLFKHAHGGRDEDLVALYSRAALVGKSFLYVASAFTLVALPAISAAYARRENTRRILWRFLSAMAAVEGLGLLVFWGATRLLMRVLLGDRPEMDALAPVARSLAVAVIPLALFQLVMLYCLATHRKGLVSLMALATASYALALWGLGDSPASFIACMGAVSLLLLLGGLALVLTEPERTAAGGETVRTDRAGGPGLKKTEAQQAGQKAHFDAEYAGYRGYHLENWRLAYIRRIFPELGLTKGVRPAFRFLDVGIGGSGYTVVEAARLGAAAWGVDLSAAGVDAAGRAADEALPKAARRRCRFEVCPAEVLPFKASSFDAVSSIAVLEHVVEHEQAMAEIARVLKPGGRAYVAVPHTYAKTPFLLGLINRVNDRQVGHLRHYSREDLLRSFEGAGLRERKTIYHAHTVKLWQFIAERFRPSMRQSGSSDWWAFEKRDWELWRDDRASMISMVLEKPSKGRVRRSARST